MVDRPLAIVHVDPERGLAGGEAQVLGLVRGLAAAGDRQVVAADPDGPLAAAVSALGVPVASLRVRSHADLLAGRRLARLLASDRYDIVHFHTARAHAMSAFLGRRPGPRRVVTRRMDYRLRGGRYVRWLYEQGADAVVAISEGVRAALVASGVRPERIVVVPSGVDLGRFAIAPSRRDAERARLDVGPHEFLLAAVGALERRKGHDLLLDAVAMLPDLPLRVFCAGAGTLADTLAARHRALGLGGRVRWLGQLHDVTGLLAAADAVVMPSRHEGLGVAAIEAMAAARPVIATRVGGLPEVIGDDAGILIPADDAPALAGAIARLACDPRLARVLGDAGRARVAERFTVEAMARGTRAVYQRLLGTETERVRT